MQRRSPISREARALILHWWAEIKRKHKDRETTSGRNFYVEANEKLRGCRS